MKNQKGYTVVELLIVLGFLTLVIGFIGFIATLIWAIVNTVS